VRHYVGIRTQYSWDDERMDRTETQKAAEVVAHIDAKVRDKLLKRARKQGLTNEAGTELAEAWKRAAKKTRHLHGHDLHNGHRKEPARMPATPGLHDAQRWPVSAWRGRASRGERSRQARDGARLLADMPLSPGQTSAGRCSLR
jgi:hypothetical protein